ncbi:hypothetical protein INT47_012353 [Mucor saturninus]|uniref:Aurora kinase n=1 Tax=Mucor saturninus TaxID=64648 RepID=A0A8H7QXI1_9FUNG|nr:hypothetical protein INT47_012353 [Mucor saturninus]
MSRQIFKSPERKSSNAITRGAPLSEYVDYTPRSLDTEAPEYNQNPNSISYAKQRRSHMYHQMAMQSEDPFTESNYMDSPVVRRHFGINTPSISYFDQKLLLAIDAEFLARKTEWHMDDFHVQTYLGTGKFGVVWQAIEQRTHTTVAIKILKKKELEEAHVVPFLKREVEIQAHLDHPNIVRLFGYFDDAERIYLVLEYAGKNDLFGELKRRQRFTEAETVKYLSQLVDALEYMHKIGVLHRDIKLENILVGHDGVIKLADFGWAVYDPQPRRNTFCGTLDYIPPEMIVNEPHSHSVDIWALGVLTFEMLTGKPPFGQTGNDADPQAVYQRITEVDIHFPSYISAGARSFICKVKTRRYIHI